jgi:hypothetical protein
VAFIVVVVVFVDRRTVVETDESLISQVSMPLGIFSNLWASGLLAGKVYDILASEVLGIVTTDVGGSGTDYVLFYALAGYEDLRSQDVGVEMPLQCQCRRRWRRHHCRDLFLSFICYVFSRPVGGVIAGGGGVIAVRSQDQRM